MRIIESKNNKEPKIKKELDTTRKKIINSLDSLANIFIVNKKAEFLFGSSFSLLDAAILPLLWRLEYYQITKKSNWTGLIKYSERLFATQEFTNSLTPAERNMKSNEHTIM